MQRRMRTAITAALGAAMAGSFALTAHATVPGKATAPQQQPSAQGAAPAEAPAQGAAAQEIREDFNGDGYEDLAIGGPGTYGTDTNSKGYVTVVHGSATGLDLAGRTLIDQDSPGVPGTAAPGNRFGDRLVARDLNADGLTDLAVTAPGHAGEGGGSGSVTVLWGAKSGLSGEGAALMAPEGTATGLGRHLTGGDFNGDGKQDLLMSGGSRTGYTVLLGPFTADGTPAATKPVDLTEGDSDLEDVVAGDVTGDGADDLFVLQNFEEMGRETRFFKGGANGLTHSSDLPPAASAAVGDFDKDGFGDLAYRVVPGGVVEELPYDAGTVKIVYGTANGPGSRTATFTQATAGVPGAHEDSDQFGGSLSAGDVTGDGYADLAVGVPFEAVGDKKEAGSVVLLKGGAKGLTGTGAQAFHQDTAGVGGVAEAGDRFGSVLRLLDVTGDGKAELTAAAPAENAENGAVWSLPGTAGGLTATGSLSFGPGDLGAPATGARFGAALGNSVTWAMAGLD